MSINIKEVIKEEDEKAFSLIYDEYGDTRMKPTDIWTNSKTWQPKIMCKNGDKCHISAPRGSKTGTQGLKGSYDRSQIPAKLCKEVLLSNLTPPLITAREK